MAYNNGRAQSRGGKNGARGKGGYEAKGPSGFDKKGGHTGGYKKHGGYAHGQTNAHGEKSSGRFEGKQNRSRSSFENDSFAKKEYRSARENESFRRQREACDKEPFFEQEQSAQETENILEGRNAVKEAIKAGREIEKILISNGPGDGSVREIAAQGRKNGVLVQEVDRIRLDKLSQTGAHQGIIAFVAAKEYCTVDDILERAKAKGEDPFIIILDGITDPQNLGSIIRSAECAGAHGVIIPKRRAVGLTPTVAKASAGAIEYMPVAKVTNIAQTVQYLKKQGVWIFGAAMDGEPATRTNLRGPIGIVIGAEGPGLGQLVRKSCDRIISLPVKGGIDSLNAAVAAAVIMYEAVRQRDGYCEKG